MHVFTELYLAIIVEVSSALSVIDLWLFLAENNVAIVAYGLELSKSRSAGGHR